MTNPLPAKVVLGLVQMAMSDDQPDNMRRAVAGVREAAAKGAQVISLPELFQTQYFCQREDQRFFKLAEPIPGQRALRIIAREHEVSSLLPCSSGARRVCITILRRFSIPKGSRASTARCTSLTIPSTTRSSISPRATSDSTFEHAFGKFGALVCWDQWYPEGARLTALRARIFSFTRPPSGGTHGKRRSTARRSMMRGEPSSDLTPLPTESTSPLSIVLATKCPPATTASNSGDKASSLSPNGQIVAKVFRDREEVMVVPVEVLF